MDNTLVDDQNYQKIPQYVGLEGKQPTNVVLVSV
jgi:hypothetical protein